MSNMQQQRKETTRAKAEEIVNNLSQNKKQSGGFLSVGKEI